MHAVHGRSPISDRRSSAAFTLLEVLVVVVILGLIAAAVVPQISRAGGMSAQAAARLIVSDLMFAQNEAIAQQAWRQVIFDPTHDSYRLADAGGTTLTAPWMGGDYVVSFADDRRFSGVSLVGVDFSGQTQVVFDDLGTPDAGGTIDVAADGTGYRITVAAFTGRITVAPVTGG